MCSCRVPIGGILVQLILLQFERSKMYLLWIFGHPQNTDSHDNWSSFKRHSWDWWSRGVSSNASTDLTCTRWNSWAPGHSPPPNTWRTSSWTRAGSSSTRRTRWDPFPTPRGCGPPPSSASLSLRCSCSWPVSAAVRLNKRRSVVDYIISRVIENMHLLWWSDTHYILFSCFGNLE